jgi:hypothetical protein
MSDQNSNYYNLDLNEDPENVFKVGTKISTFGGPNDKEDNGQFAFGGSSVENGQESQENYAAVDPAWYKNGIKPGSTVYVQNPETGAQVPVVLRDKGPARWTGRGIDVAPHVLDLLGAKTDQDVVVNLKPALTGQTDDQPAQSDQQNPNAPQQGLEDLTTPEGAKSYVDRTMASGAPTMAATGSQAGTRSDITGTKEDLGVTKLPDGGYDLGGGVVGYPNGIFQMRTGNSITEYIPDQSQDSGYKTHTFTTKSSSSNNPDDVMAHEGAKKGVVRSDYPEGPDGDKQYKDELKLTLGAGVADDIAEAITSGKQPPDTKGLYRTGPMVRAKLAKMGYDLKDANLDWQAAQRFVLSQNSPPLVRLRMSANTAYHSLDLIDQYAKEWNAGGFPALNHARLVAAQQGAFGPKAATLARQLDGQITDLTFELGNVYMGGGTPTDQAIQLAKKNLSADWPEGTLEAMTGLARKNLQIRLNSFKQVEPAGISDEAAKESRWSQAKQTSPSPTPAPTPSTSNASPRVGQTVKVNGKMVTIDSIDPKTGTFTYH